MGDDSLSFLPIAIVYCLIVYFSIICVLGDDSLSVLPIVIVFTVFIYNIKMSSCKNEEVRRLKKSSGFLITDNRMNVQHLFTTSATTES